MTVLDCERDFILDPSCVLYLPLWKKDGSSFMSDDHYGRLATVTGALWTPNQGRYFDEVDDTITVPFTMPSEFSFILWGKAIGTASSPFNDCYISVNSCLRIRSVGTINGPQLNTYNGGTWDALIYGLSVAQQAEWHCYAGSVTNNAEIIYLDGSLVTSGATAWVLNNDIAFAGTSFHPARYVGEFIAYNRILSAAEFANIYDATKWRYK